MDETISEWGGPVRPSALQLYSIILKDAIFETQIARYEEPAGATTARIGTYAVDTRQATQEKHLIEEAKPGAEHIVWEMGRYGCQRERFFFL